MPSASSVYVCICVQARYLVLASLPFCSPGGAGTSFSQSCNSQGMHQSHKHEQIACEVTQQQRQGGRYKASHCAAVISCSARMSLLPLQWWFDPAAAGLPPPASHHDAWHPAGSSQISRELQSFRKWTKITSIACKQATPTQNQQSCDMVFSYLLVPQHPPGAQPQALVSTVWQSGWSDDHTTQTRSVKVCKSHAELWWHNRGSGVVYCATDYIQSCKQSSDNQSHELSVSLYEVLDIPDWVQQCTQGTL